MSSTVGPYRLTKRLGAGGMGEVWEAERDGARVALKMLPAASEGEASTLRKFLQEARIGQNLDHRNIVRVLEAGVDHHRGYIAMELLEGRTLAQLPKEPLPVPLVVELARQALAALEHAHAFIVHRDLKPSNLFLTRDGVLKVIDFGIAVWGDAERTRTATGLMRGSLPYSTPEQAKNEPVDARSDLFSLGLVLHELLTGERVLNGASDAAIVTALLMAPIPGVRAARPEVPEALDAAITRALERDRSLRPASARELLVAISASLPASSWWSEADVAAWLARQPPVVAEATGTESLPAAPAPVARPGRRAPLALAGVAVIATASAGAWYATRPAPLPPPPPPPMRVEVAVDAGAPAVEPELNEVVDAGAQPTAPPVPPPSPPLKRGTGWLTIDARPSWGTVYIDGKKLGPTPLYRQVLPQGRHLVEVEKEDGTRKKRKVLVAPGKEQQVVFTW